MISVVLRNGLRPVATAAVGLNAGLYPRPLLPSKDAVEPVRAGGRWSALSLRPHTSGRRNNATDINVGGSRQGRCRKKNKDQTVPLLRVVPTPPNHLL